MFSFLELQRWRPYRCYCGNPSCIYNLLNNRRRVRRPRRWA